MEHNIKLHIIFGADATLDGTLLETYHEKVLNFPDKPAAWSHLFRRGGEAYERIVPDDVADGEEIPDIYVLKRY